MRDTYGRQNLLDIKMVFMRLTSTRLAKLYHWKQMRSRGLFMRASGIGRLEVPSRFCLISTSKGKGDYDGVELKSVATCCEELTCRLVQSGTDEARVEAEYILAFVLGRQTLHGVSGKTLLTDKMWEKCLQLADKRLERIPLQYIFGEWNFRDLLLKMSPPVFIQRPETEELVEFMLKDDIVKNSNEFLEVGCGTGAISLSLLSCLPEIKVTAVDILPEACHLTQHNSRMLGLNSRMTVSNMSFCDYLSSCVGSGLRFDFVVSNPPYIPTKDMANLAEEIKCHESHQALHGGFDGMEVIRQLLDGLPTIMAKSSVLWLEVDSSHPRLLEQYVKHSPHWKKLQTFSDFQNMPRFCRLVFDPDEK